MKISASQIELQASHTATTESYTHERLSIWNRGPANRQPQGNAAHAASNSPPPARDRVSLSSEARDLAATEVAATSEREELDGLTPQLRMMVRMIEHFTGRPVKLFTAQQLTNPASMPANSSPSTVTGTDNGAGLEYIRESHYAEHEAVAFQASGVVRTADGREIQFQLGFEMQRSYSESSQVSVRLGAAAQQQLQDPLVFDFGGNAQGLSDMRFNFDLDSDGIAEAVPMLNHGRGYLAFDRNQNGAIDNGKELFGPATGNGFAELAALDSDGNGWIDEADAAFDKLYVWRPSADGAGTLETLRAAGIGALYLGQVTTPFELRGQDNNTLGVMRSSSIYLNENGTAGTLSQVDLSV